MTERELFADHLDRLKSDAECVNAMAAWIEPHALKPDWETFMLNVEVKQFLKDKGWVHVMRGIGAALILKSYHLETATDRVQAESQGLSDE